MITKPTVLILGAGASVDYGFPTGRGLLFEICRESRQSGSLWKFLTDRMEKDPRSVEKFASALEKSMAPSVDRFLEENRQYEEIGKLAIAAMLIPREDFDSLVPSETPRWYETLFHLMVEGGHFQNNKLSILTFNYDRSLEACFFQALKNFYNLSDATAENELKKIAIIHLYGSLGDNLTRVHTHLGDTHRGYESDRRPNWVDEAARKIKIVHEAQPGQEFERALNALSLAHEVIFLGFGFHPSNIERLRLHQAARSHDTHYSYENIRQRWLACRYGMGDGEVARAKAYLGELPVEFAPNSNWGINEYLKNTECLIPDRIENTARRIRVQDESETVEMKDSRLPETNED